MPAHKQGDRIWLVLSTFTGVVVDLTLNKYSGSLNDWWVAGLWSLVCLFFVVWVWRVEKTRAWVKNRLLEHPVSYALMLLILIPFTWQATATMIMKISRPQSEQAKTLSSCPAQPAGNAFQQGSGINDDVTIHLTPEQRAANLEELKKLELQYFTAHPGPLDERAAVQWINAQLTLKGYPVTITGLGFKKPDKPRSETLLDTPLGTGVIGPQNEMEVDHVFIAGFHDGVNASGTQNLKIKNSQIYAPGALPQPGQSSPQNNANGDANGNPKQ